MKKIVLCLLLILCLLCGCTEEERETTVEPVADCDHEWSAYIVTEEPTKESVGVRVSVCSLCKEERTEEVPSLSTENYFLYRIPSTCTEEGMEEYASDEWGTYTVYTAPIGHEFGSTPSSVTATCTEAGVSYYPCARCAYVEEVATEAFGHTDEVTYYREGCAAVPIYTCTRCHRQTEGLPVYSHVFDEGVYYEGSCTAYGYTEYTCSSCTETKRVYDTEYRHIYNKDTGRCTLCTAVCPHTFDKNFRCTACSFDIYEELGRNGYYLIDNDGNGIADVGETVYFGTYPQSHVSDGTLIAALDGLEGNEPDKVTEYGGYTYYCASVENQPYRSVLNFSDGTSMSAAATRKEHYFRVDPIAWTVRSNTDGLYLISDVILDTYPYQFSQKILTVASDYYYTEDGKNGSVYANDWSVSNLRTQLNTVFLETAFSEKERAMLMTAALDNTKDGYYNETYKYQAAAHTTEDKVFIPTYADVFGEEEPDADSDERKRVLSDYALCGAVAAEWDERTAVWYLRSSGTYSGRVCAVTETGALQTALSVAQTAGNVLAVRMNPDADTEE